MFKRLFWMLVGVGFGVGLAFWVTRTVRGTVERVRPDRVAGDLAGAITQFGQDIRAAVAEGAQAMRDREAELRSGLKVPPS